MIPGTSSRPRSAVTVINSNGDLPMLEYLRRSGPTFALLVHHDDDSGRGDAPYDSGAELALAEVAAGAITEVRVKNDWSSVFAE